MDCTTKRAITKCNEGLGELKTDKTLNLKKLKRRSKFQMHYGKCRMQWGFFSFWGLKSEYFSVCCFNFDCSLFLICLSKVPQLYRKVILKYSFYQLQDFTSSFSNFRRFNRLKRKHLLAKACTFSVFVDLTVVIEVVVGGGFVLVCVIFNIINILFTALTLRLYCRGHGSVWTVETCFFMLC